MTVPIRASSTAITTSGRPSRAKRNTSPASTRRSEYRSRTESRKAPNGETRPETRASAPSRISSTPAIARQSAPSRRWSAANAPAATIEPTRPRKESWFGRSRRPTSARATGSATRATSPLYRPSIGHGRPGERRFDRLAQVLERHRRLHLPAPAVGHVERVQRVIQIGGDLRGSDVEPLGGQGPGDEIQEPESVWRLHL